MAILGTKPVLDEEEGLLPAENPEVMLVNLPPSQPSSLIS
jgi:hypothetical protein